ncbi:MAG: hypothetical protein K1X61_03050 [Chitinophagales bacterium]|nr:hypothetical protein [Chitinophagales bacterium]
MNSPDITSRILLDFKHPVTAANITIRPEPFTIPPTAFAPLKDYWTQQLKEKQSALQKAGIISVIKSDTAHGALATLYVHEKPVMWPGTAVTLRDATIINGQVLLTVSDIPYPFIAALNDAAFLTQSGLHGLDLRPPLAVCTFAITTDNMLVLTQRGQTTGVYPGRLYGQGGNPHDAQFNIIEHQLEEMADELLVAPEEADADSFRYYGLAEDLESFPRKPDLVGIVRLRMDASTLLARNREWPAEDRPPDVASLLCVPYNKQALDQFLLQEKTAADFCPPAYAGLRWLISEAW